MNLFHRFLYFFCVVFTLGCSQRSQQNDYTELPVDEVCVLRENNEPLGKIVSFCIIDDDRFVASTAEGKIMVFDRAGNQLLQIARRGRGPFEYVEPSIIRATKDDRLIVWCAYLTKFLVFSLRDGQPLFERAYPSSVRDFVPLEENLVYVYSGNENAGIVFKYDLSSGDVMEQGGDWSVSHDLMMIMSGRCPLSSWDGSLYYMPVSELCIYELGDRQAGPVAKIPSASFHVRNPSKASIIDDTQKRIQHAIENPRVLLLDVTEDEYMVVALELKESPSSRNTKRYNVIYRFNRDSNKLSCITCFPARNPDLMDLYRHDIYYIQERGGDATNTAQYKLVMVSH